MIPRLFCLFFHWYLTIPLYKAHLTHMKHSQKHANCASENSVQPEKIVPMNSEIFSWKMNSDQTHRSPPPIKIIKSSSGSLKKNCTKPSTSSSVLPCLLPQPQFAFPFMHTHKISWASAYEHWIARVWGYLSPPSPHTTLGTVPEAAYFIKFSVTLEEKERKENLESATGISICSTFS